MNPRISLCELCGLPLCVGVFHPSRLLHESSQLIGPRWWQRCWRRRSLIAPCGDKLEGICQGTTFCRHTRCRGRRRRRRRVGYVCSGGFRSTFESLIGRSILICQCTYLDCVKSGQKRALCGLGKHNFHISSPGWLVCGWKWANWINIAHGEWLDEFLWTTLNEFAWVSFACVFAISGDNQWAEIKQ